MAAAGEAAARSSTGTAPAIMVIVATHAERVGTTPTTAADTGLITPAITPATATATPGEDKMIAPTRRDGRPTHLRIRPQRQRRSRPVRQEPKIPTSPTAMSSRGLPPHGRNMQSAAGHGEITNGATTTPPTTLGTPAQAALLAAPPGSAGSRPPPPKRAPRPAPTMQTDRTSGDLILLRPALRPLQLLHCPIHGWRAQQAGQPLQPPRPRQSSQLRLPNAALRLQHITTAALRLLRLQRTTHGWRVQQAAQPPHPQ